MEFLLIIFLEINVFIVTTINRLLDNCAKGHLRKETFAKKNTSQISQTSFLRKYLVAQMSRCANVSLRNCPVTQVSCNLINRNAEFQAKRLNFAFVIIAQFLYSKSSARTFLFSNRSNILRDIRRKSTSRRNPRQSGFSSSRIEADYYY